MSSLELINQYSLREAGEEEIVVAGDYPYSNLTVQSLVETLSRRIIEGSSLGSENVAYEPGLQAETDWSEAA